MPLFRPRVPIPPTVIVWGVTIRQKHLRVAIAHPHHYLVAFLLTAFLWLIGHFEPAGVYAAWGYAFFENVTTAAEIE